MIKLISLIKGSIGYLSLFFVTLIFFVVLCPLGLLKKYTTNTNVKKYCLICLHKIGSAWITINFYTVKLLNRLDWQVQGAEQLISLPKDKWYLLIANHQSWNDVFILQFLFRNQLPFQKYFVKEQMRKFPVMGFVWESIDCPFLKRLDKDRIKNNPELVGLDLLEIKEKSKKFKLLPSTIVSFAEGTRFSAKKHAEQKSPYQYLLKPKAGGIACTLQELHREIKGIVDVTLVYPHHRTSLWDLYTGKLNKITAKIQFLPIPPWLIEHYKNNIDYQDYKDQFQSWLNDIWVEKDLFIKTHRLNH